MLIYLSSYPRSGNTWVRHLIRHYFDRRSASLYREEKGAPNLVQNEDGSFGPAFSEYQTQYPPITTRLRLVNGCGPILSKELRRHLGASDEYFFLKTHELPYERYFDGECVIHLVRHPGAVFWSYYNYIRDNEPDRTLESLRNWHKAKEFHRIAPNFLPDFLMQFCVFLWLQLAKLYHATSLLNPTIEDVIKGRVPFGSWSTCNERWLECGEALGDRFLIFPYEQLASGEAEFCEKVSSLTGLPIRRDIGSFPRFEHWHRTAPALFRSGKVDEWKSYLSESQLKLIKRLHGSIMAKLGYTLS